MGLVSFSPSSPPSPSTKTKQSPPRCVDLFSVCFVPSPSIATSCYFFKYFIIIKWFLGTIEKTQPVSQWVYHQKPPLCSVSFGDNESRLISSSEPLILTVIFRCSRGWLLWSTRWQVQYSGRVFKSQTHQADHMLRRLVVTKMTTHHMHNFDDNLCSGQFTCNDGQCINIEQRWGFKTFTAAAFIFQKQPKPTHVVNSQLYI